MVMMLILIVPVVASAERTNPTTLNELIVLVLRTNLGLQIEQMQVEQEMFSTVVEDAVFDPELFSILSYDRRKAPLVLTDSSGRFLTQETGGQIGVRKRFTTGLAGSLSLLGERASGTDSFNALDPRYRSAVVLELNQPLLRNQGRDINTTAMIRSRYRLQQTGLTYLLQAQRLALQLEFAVRHLAAGEQTIQLRRQALDLAEQLLRANQIRFDEGLVPITEVQGAQAARAARQLRYVQAQQQKDLLLTQLNRQVDWQLTADFDPLQVISSSIVAFDEESYELEASLATARRKRLDLQIAKLSVKSQQQQQTYLENQLQPQLDLRLQAGINGFAGQDHNGGRSSFEGGWFDSIDGMGRADGYQWGAALEFSIPLGNRAAQSRYRQAQVVTRQQQYRLADLDAQLQHDLREQLINLEHSQKQLAIAVEFENLATIALDQEQRRLDEGLSDTYRLLSFQDDMIDAKINRLQAAVEYQLAQAQMAFARGEILERFDIHLTDPMEDFHH